MILTSTQYIFLIIALCVAMYGIGYYARVRKEKEKTFLEQLDNKSYRAIMDYKNLNNINIMRIGDKNKK